MPTYIPSILEFNGSKEQIIEVKNFLRGKPNKEGNKMHIDFNNIVGMPEELQVEHNSYAELAQFLIFGVGGENRVVEEAQKVFSNLDEEIQKFAVKLAIKYHSNYLKYGHSTWNSWRYANWGTKLNACNQYMPDDNTIWFDTTENHVTMLIQTLSKRFPEVDFQYVFEVECNGTYGKVKIKNGEVNVIKSATV